MCTDEENTPPVEFKLCVQITANAGTAVHKVVPEFPLAFVFSQRCNRQWVPAKAGAVAPSCGTPGTCRAPPSHGPYDTNK